MNKIGRRVKKVAFVADATLRNHKKNQTWIEQSWFDRIDRAFGKAWLLDDRFAK